MKISIKNINNYSDKFYQDYYSKLNNYQKNKIKKLKNIEDKKLSLLGLILTSNILNIDISKIYFKKKKPYIKSTTNYFSISHKYPYVIVVLDNNPIGVDIEKIIKVNKVTQKYLKCVNSLESLIKWTREESLFKINESNNIKIQTTIIDKKYIISIAKGKR